MARSNPVLDAALEYARRGWPVVILHGIRDGGCTCRRKRCKRPGKHPLSWRGLKDATRNQARIRSWFHARPWANLAIAVGYCDLAVLDIDLRKDGEASLRNLLRQGIDTRRAGKVRTGNGWHLYFLGHVPTTSGELGSGLDVRSRGSYVVAPPSHHLNGSLYAWERPVDELPPWPFSSRKVEAAPVGEAIPEGQRNSRLFRLAGSLHYHGLPHELVAEVLALVNQRLCRPPLEADEVQEMALKVSRRPRDGRQIMRDLLSSRAGTGSGPAAAPEQECRVAEAALPPTLHPTFLRGDRTDATN